MKCFWLHYVEKRGYVHVAQFAHARWHSVLADIHEALLTMGPMIMKFFGRCTI